MIAKERKRDIKRGKEEIRRQRRREEKVGGSSRESGYRKKGGEGERQREKDNEGMKERERKFREIEGVEREGGRDRKTRARGGNQGDYRDINQLALPQNFTQTYLRLKA